MSLRPLLIPAMLSTLLAVVFAQPACGATGVTPVPLAEPSAEGKPVEALRFRRVYAPADQVKDWPLGNVKYMRMDAAQFERLLKIVQTTTPGGQASLGARTVTAQYQARLVADQLTAGQATVQVIHSAETPALLPLDPFGLGVGKATWGGKEPRPATLGLGVDGKLQVLVEGSGQLDFEWSLLGQRDAEDVLNFRFELPACPTNRLILDLPDEMTPVADQGVVLQAGWADEGLRRWQIELGGHHRFRLRVLPAGAAQRRRQLPLLRESVKYQLMPHGLDVSAELEFEVHNGPLQQVTVALDPELQLVSAQCGDVPVPWSPAAGNGGPATRIALTLPGPARDAPCVVRLQALAPLATGRRWRLPRIQSEEVLWQEGVATLLVPAPLSIQQLLPVGCRQTGTGTLSGARGGESAQFQFFAPDATVEITLSRRHPPVQLASGTAIELTDRGMTARQAADFRVGEDPRFVLDADISRGWLIDSVESFPPEAMDDWDLVGPSGGRQKLTIRLAEALSPTRPVRLVLSARHLQSPLGRELGTDDLVPLRFQAAAESRRLVAVRAVAPYQLRLAGAEALNRIDPGSLGATERQLFADPQVGARQVGALPDDLLFENDPNAAELRISLESRPPGYTARLGVEAIVGEETLQERYTLHCAAGSSRVERVLVYFSHRRQVPLRWTLGADGDQRISARQLSDKEQTAAGLGPQQDAWELTLRQPWGESFEIHGTREIKLNHPQVGTRQVGAPQPVSLISLPEATGQRATLVVRSLGSQGVRIVNRRLTPIPAETIPPDRYQTARATYRYDPLRDLAGLPEPAVSVSRSRDTVTPPAWIWDCQLVSRYEASGSGRHLVTYRLQNSGGGVLRLDLPSGVETADVRGVWVDGERIPLHRLTAEQAGRLTIDLPQGEKFPAVSILFATPPARLGMIGSLSAPLPEVDLEVLAQHWAVQLPPGYDPRDPDLRRQLSAAGPMSWSERLFGPLGRAAGQAAFDPLAAIARLFAPAETPEPAPAAAPAETPQPPPAEAKLPWADAGWAAIQPPGTHGRNTYNLQIMGTSPTRLEYVRRETLHLLGWVSFLLVIALGWWIGGNRPEMLTWLAGGFGCAALLLPEAYVPVASGAWLGTLCCLTCGLIRQGSHWHDAAATQSSAGSSTRPARPRTAGGTGVTPVARLMGALLLLPAAVGATCAVAHGEQPEPPPPSPPPVATVHRVFIPVDQNGQPTGDKYYVPQEVYNLLLRRGTAATEKPHGWLIKAATYRGVLSRETSSARLAVEELTADFALRVFDGPTRVRIPIGREGANLLPDGVLLDGRLIQPEWDANGSGLLLEVPQPGEYRLELSLRPSIRSDGVTAGFDLEIPSLAASRLELGVPPHPVGTRPGGTGVTPVALQVPSALGMISTDEQPSRVIAELGPTNRLTVRWPEGTGRSATASAVDVEELLWMKVQPGSVVIDAKLKFRIAQGQIRQVRLAVDPRLRLLPLEGDNPPAVDVRKTPGQPQVLTVRWSGPVSDQVVLSARFFWTGASGVGNLRLPHLKALDARSTRRWLAVSVDPALQHKEQVSAGVEAVAPPHFLGSWGPSESQPLVAYRLPPDDTTWSMATQLCEPRTTVEQKLTLSVDREEAAVQFDAQLAPAAGYVFQHRLLVPAALRVESVSVLEDGVWGATGETPVPRARWSQDEEGTVTVFLTELMAGPQKLSLRGHLPIRGTKMPLPVLQVEAGQVRSSTIELFRRPAVLVKLAEAKGLQPVDDPTIEVDQPEWGRLVGQFRAPEQEPIEATLTLTPNRPQVQAEQVTWLRCHGGSWQAEIAFRLHVAGGVVDQIRIDAPAPFSGPYQVSPLATLKTVDAPGGRRQLVVRPPAAIVTDYQFSISSPLTLGPGDRPSAPQVALRQASGLEQFLVLPKEADGQPIEWRRQDLKEAQLPAGFDVPPDATSLATYQVVGRDYRAILSRNRGRQDARVRLADVQVTWQADRSCVGVATFDLEPGRAPTEGRSSECGLRLPSNYRLLQVSVAGVPTEPAPVDPAPADASLWRVPLGPARLPQQIEVFFSGHLPEPGTDRRLVTAGSQSFDAPALEDLPVEQTLWTVVGPTLFEPGEPEDGSLLSPRPQDLYRLRSAAALIESASTTTAEDPEETLRWYRLWARRLAAAQMALKRLPAPAGPAQTAQAEEIAAVDAQQSQIAQRLGVTDVYQQLKREGVSLVDDPAALWQRTLRSGQTSTCCTVPRRSDSITLSYRRVQTSGLPYRLMGATSLAAAIVLVVAGLRRGTLAECFKRWPQAIGVAAGLAWWLWLQPSALGWGIVLVSLAASLLSGWRHSPPAPHSSVVSLQARQGK